MTAIEEFYKEYTDSKEVKRKNTTQKIHHMFRKYNLDRTTLASKLLPSKIETLLDYGCSKGGFLIKNKRKYKQCIGVDISSRALIEAKKKLPHAQFVKGNTDEKQLKINKNSVDVINCSDTIEHVFNPEKMIQEFNRILKMGGVAIIITPNIAFLKYRLDLLFGNRPRTSYAQGWDGGHISYFTFKDMKKLVEKHGFKIVKKTTGGIFYKWRTWWPELLGGNVAIVAKKVK